MLCRSEFLVFQHGSFQELHQSVSEQVRIGRVIKPELHFFEVGGKMLCGESIPAFLKCPD
jgi:hypothetical protein